MRGRRLAPVALAAVITVGVVWNLGCGEPPPESAEEALARAHAVLDSPDPSHRRAARLCLLAARMGDEVVLTEAFVTLLHRVEEPYRLRALLEGLQDPVPRVREGAAMTLGALGDERGVEALVAALGDVETVVVRAAASSLQQILTRQPNLLIHLIGRSEDLAREYRSLATIDARDPRARDAVVEALGDDDVFVRERAFELLVARYVPARGCHEPAKPAAIGALEDRSGSVRRHAAMLLRHCADADVVPALAEALRNETETNNRREMRLTLQEVRDPAAIDSLLAALNDLDGDVRQGAARSLAGLREPRATRGLALYLLRALGDPSFSYTVRFRGVETERASYPPDVSIVIEGIQGSDPSLAVRIFLEALGDPNDVSMRRNGALALAEIHDETAVGPLVDALEDSDDEVRTAAATALGGMEATLAIGPLVDAYEAADVHEQSFRRAVHGALVRIVGFDFGGDPASWRRWWTTNAIYFRDGPGSQAP